MHWPTNPERAVSVRESHKGACANSGEYFPVVTIQTTAGRFSSIGGWNAVALDESSTPVRINVQASPTVASFVNITDPVDLKWSGDHLYVPPRSTATITEFTANGSSIRSLSGIGSNPSGLDVDAVGNVYVAVTGNHQVWKLNPTTSSFAADTSFGTGGHIGNADGSSGTGLGQFNAPFDVAVSPDGGTLSVSDSGNNQIQQFDISGHCLRSFGSAGSDLGQFYTPKGSGKIQGTRGQFLLTRGQGVSSYYCHICGHALGLGHGAQVASGICGCDLSCDESG